MIIEVILISASSLLFGSGFLACVLAWKKGYHPWFWLLSLGPVGLLFMLFSPSLFAAATPEIREKWEDRADWTGGILSGLTFFFLLVPPTIGFLTSFSLAAPPMPTRPMAPMMAPVSSDTESSGMSLESDDGGNQSSSANETYDAANEGGPPQSRGGSKPANELPP